MTETCTVCGRESCAMALGYGRTIAAAVCYRLGYERARELLREALEWLPHGPPGRDALRARIRAFLGEGG